MALLEQLRVNLLNLDYDEGLLVFQEYCQKREEDFQKVIVTPKATKAKKTGKKDKKVTVNAAQLELLKKLGLI